MQRDSRAIIGFAVLSDHEGAPFRQPADLFRADDCNVLPEKVRPAILPVCQVLRETRVWPTRSEISRLNAPSLEPLQITNTLVRPNKARDSCSPKTAASCRHL